MVSSAVIIFPGSNCDRDAMVALEQITGKAPHKVWHLETTLPNVDLVVLPGGFSYGDYLRCGGIAAHSPIMAAVKAHAERGGLLLGICNGFQVLLETGLLPGALLRNAGLNFICKNVYLKVESADSPFTNLYQDGEVISIPVAHHDGNYFASESLQERLEGNGQVAFRYCHWDGTVDADANPNGSSGNIAGIWNERRNILGMMPHPERHADHLTGGTDGERLFAGLKPLKTMLQA